MSEAMSRVPELWQGTFLSVREIPGRGLCAVQRFAYTCGLLLNVRFDGLTYFYDARYCYPLMSDAVEDLREWGGEGDPPGDWVKEKVSERGRHD